MADKPKDETPKQNLSDEIAQRVKAQIIHGDVGYGRPPKEHQFKKGQRANPSGRPRKAAPDLTLSEQPLLSAFQAALNQTVRGQDGVKAVEISAAQALAQKGLGFALNGNARYFGILVDIGRQAEEARARDIRENNEFWSTYQRLAREAIVEAKARGEPEPQLLPHPDDIITDREGRLRHIGPFDEISKAAIEKNIVLRQAFLLQGGLDERLMPRPADGDPLKGPGTAFQFAKLINRSLPPRLRMDEFRMFCEIDYYSRHPLRWLLKTVFETWRRAGKQRKRGELSPPLGVGLAAVNMFYTLAEGMLDGTLEKNSGAEQLVEMILENRRVSQQEGWI